MNKQNVRNLKIQLQLLNEIQKKKNHSQRSISKELNIALGLVNSIIKKFVNKGFLKLSEAPMKRYFYYITPKGLIEKVKLTRDFFKSSLEFYNIARNQYEQIFLKLKKQNPEKIFLLGTSEFAEIAILSAKINNISLDGIIHPKSKKKRFCDLRIEKSVNRSYEGNKKIFFIITDNKLKNDFRNKNLNLITPDFLEVS